MRLKNSRRLRRPASFCQHCPRRIIRQIQGAILYVTDERSVHFAGLLLDLNPFLVLQEFLPTIGHGFPVRPFKEINEFGSVVFFRFPGGNYLEVIFGHDAHGMISKSVMKRFFIAIKYFVHP